MTAEHWHNATTNNDDPKYNNKQNNTSQKELTPYKEKRNLNNNEKTDEIPNKAGNLSVGPTAQATKYSSYRRSFAFQNIYGVSNNGD